ncbi:hypothetical protein Glove_217g47 [Diversispora epigaea]|uniref:TLDc domain-containing protein n=1 Tax=Diversispora epigaea TaxID=1348612 RepID=A0A397IH18_9GLOM|nr:hypothetical protein Glove_217g47 [Diversispora epigaea]
MVLLKEHFGNDNTIVITKVEGTDEIIGGSNLLAWDKTKTGWVKTNKSFIFSFKDDNLQNPILCRVKNENYALLYPSDKDCEFMIKLDVSDFTQDKINHCCNNSENNLYEKSI